MSTTSALGHMERNAISVVLMGPKKLVTVTGVGAGSAPRREATEASRGWWDMEGRSTTGTG